MPRKPSTAPTASDYLKTTIERAQEKKPSKTESATANPPKSIQEVARPIDVVDAESIVCIEDAHPMSPSYFCSIISRINSFVFPVVSIQFVTAS